VRFQPFALSATASAGLSVRFVADVQSIAAGAGLSVAFVAVAGGGAATAGLGLAFSPNPVPGIVALRPTQVRPGRGAFALTASGTDFAPGATLFWNGSPRATTWITPTEVRAAIPAADVEAVGAASITVENPDPDLGLSAAATFSVAGTTPTFTDDPLTPRVTVARVVHVTELRQGIDELRSRYGLAAFPWTDGPPVARTTPVKAIHLTELRAALGDVFTAAGEAPPPYTDSPVVAGVTPVTAAQIAEIRSAIARLW